MPYQSRFSIKSQHALNLLEETLYFIDMMSIEDREDLMRLMFSCMIAEKFGIEGRIALQAISKYCIAKCLLNDPAWKAPGRRTDDTPRTGTN